MKGFFRGIYKALGAGVGAAIFVVIKTKYPQSIPIIDVLGPIVFPITGAYLAPKNQ